jgi:glycerol-3-phosphate acyltransferase PlsX
LVTIAVDAMGGDHAPKSEIEGSLRAVRHLPVEVILVGQEDVLRAELNAHHPGWEKLPIRLHHASEVVTMDDSAGKALRTKKDSSIRVACRLMHEGSAMGVVSAGNTGAVMATSKTVNGP